MTRADAVGANVREAILDYLASGLDPENGRTFFFSHSHVPELNQLLLPFMSLVTTAELDRNPTVKEEIRAAGLRQVNALMYTYAIHQAADILFCKGNVVPVGRDQLPHLELTRKIARRFNERFSPEAPVFPVPDALLSDLPVVLGTDGQKMSKSRGNTIMLKMTAEETAKAIKGAKTDADRHITYDPAQPARGREPLAPRRHLHRRVARGRRGADRRRRRRQAQGRAHRGAQRPSRSAPGAPRALRRRSRRTS